MSQRDVLAELRAARIEAPPELRDRIRLVAAAGATPPHRRITWRRALVVALPVAAAVAAAVALTRPSHHAPRAVPGVNYGAVTSGRPLLVPPTPRNRVQTVGTTLTLRIPTADGVSDALKRALQITASLSGYPASVHEQTHGNAASATLTLKIPRAHLQQAMTRLSRLGTITGEHVDVTDRQAGLNATDREIARLQRQLKALRAQQPPNTKLIAAVTAHVERLQRAEAATRRAAHYATVHLGLATPAPTPATHGHGPFHGILVGLTWLGIGAVYALALGLPVAIVLAGAWFLYRAIRRRREDALLNGR